MQKALPIADIKTVTDYLEKEVIDYINEGRIETFESFKDFDIVAFDWCDPEDIDVAPSQIMAYIDREDLFVFCENESAFDRAQKALKERPSNDEALYDFFDELLDGDAERLEALEDEINDADDALLRGVCDGCPELIVSFRRRLLRWKKYYEQLRSIFEELSLNVNGLLSAEAVRRFGTLELRADRRCANVVNLREYVTQVREAYQAQIDIQQNRLMKIFTVVTAIFLPLTLIVGWYGMNFDMPEFSWEYGYSAVIALSVVVVVACVAIFKKRRWM